jgi:hypothetical protein
MKQGDVVMCLQKTVSLKKGNEYKVLESDKLIFVNGSSKDIVKVANDFGNDAWYTADWFDPVGDKPHE